MVLPAVEQEVLAFFLVYPKEASSEVADTVHLSQVVQGSTGLYYPAHHQMVFASVGLDRRSDAETGSAVLDRQLHLISQRQAAVPAERVGLVSKLGVAGVVAGDSSHP